MTEASGGIEFMQARFRALNDKIAKLQSEVDMFRRSSLADCHREIAALVDMLAQKNQLISKLSNEVSDLRKQLRER